MKAPRLLMVDDEPDVGAFVRSVTESLGYDMRFTAPTETFKALHRSFRPDLVILDLAMPGTDGIELLRFLAGEKSRARILLMSGFATSVRAAALRLGEAHGLRMAGIVPKPVQAAELRLLLVKLKSDRTS